LPGSIQQLLIRDAARLAAALALDAGTARLEVQSLLQLALNVSRASLLAHTERRPDSHEQSRYGELLQRRLRGEPLAYILGEREFFGLMFKVTTATLIPRPETELLVELALQRIPPHQPGRILDLGTGCGAIAISIAHARPDVVVVAVEASAAALSVARENARRLKVGNIVFETGNWLEPLDMQRFDLIVSNPPYVAAGDPHLQQGDLRFEPLSALAAGSDGLQDIRQIIPAAPAHLHSGGWLMFDGYDQAAVVRSLLLEAGLAEVFSARDLAGIDRVSAGRSA
jgi:release factor glutamine methyltransferase